MCVCVSECHVCADAQGGQKRALQLLELECELCQGGGNELGSYGNAARALNSGAMSPAQGLLLANEKGRRRPALCCPHLSLKRSFTSPPNWEAGLYYVLRRLFYELTVERSRSDPVANRET